VAYIAEATNNEDYFCGMCLSIVMHVHDRWITAGLHVVCLLSPVPPATAAALPLAVEVGGGDRRSEAVAGGEVPGVEVCAPPGRVDRLPDRLPEHDEHEPVDPRRWPGALVRHHLVTMIGTSSFWYVSHQPRYIT